MLTPQEVSERAFPKASFGGYNMSQVDEFLDVLTEDYSALYSENAVLKSKMKVLVEKVEEYRSTEEAMRKALMTAQRMADDLVKEAESRRDQILRQAEGEAQQKVDAIRREAEAERFRLEAAKRDTAAYVEKVKALHAQAVSYLENLAQLVPEAPAPQEEDRVEQAAGDIDDSVQRLVAQAWPRPPRRTRRPAWPRRSSPTTCPTPPSSPPSAARRSTRTTTWSRPPASTSASSSLDGTTRSNDKMPLRLLPERHFLPEKGPFSPLTSRKKADNIKQYIGIMRGKGQVPAPKTLREPPFGARRTGGDGEPSPWSRGLKAQ